MNKNALLLKYTLLGILCLLFFNFPILGIFNEMATGIFGIPKLFSSVFIIWLIFIIVLILIKKQQP
jgi:hypothetical protein